MKRILTIILAASFLLASACTKTNNIPNQGGDINRIKQSAKADLTLVNASNITNTTDVGTIGNIFFFNKNSKLQYKGTFLFDDIIKKDVKLNIKELADLRYGKLYELKIDSIEGVRNERLNLGYFYVQKDKIYRIGPTKENFSKLKTSEELPEGSVIVCQDKEIKDALNRDQAGSHHYLEVNGNRREYHSLNNKVTTGYYESFTWEKGKGLTNYRSGFGAERDSITLQLINN
ncbi:hypothetical protein [Acetonema longum]|uniref:Lipoprotein n=1 Tax=Acetonema longum DSM 6540 TaxID=1009370 RepID=F7NNE1_9FIRM|nr:hypothetical protein [Acetonema longum]EGO62442.1 hypothetical protein ALO_18160 [Acetonema longum DSM 6540]